MNEQSAEDFARLAVRFHDEPTVAETLDSVLTHALDGVGCTYAGVVFFHGRQRLETAAATDAIVGELEQVQITCGEGPDLDVFAGERTIKFVCPEQTTFPPRFQIRRTTLAAPCELFVGSGGGVPTKCPE